MVGRKLLIIVASLFFLLGILASPTFAQQDAAVESSQGMVAEPDILIPPLPPPGEPGFLGQDHNYSVVFRGNGEAVVSLKVAFTNKTDDPLTDVNLRIPKVQPGEVSVYQVMREKRCIRYEFRILDPVTRVYPPQVCAEYQDPDYYQAYYSGSKYQKAEHELDIDTLKVTLPNEVEPNKSGSFFVYFRALGYAKKNLYGAYKFTFETLKVEDDIRNLRVGINTDSDMVLRGATGEVQYRFEEDTVASFEKAALGAPVASVAIDTYYSSIGQGRITKTASNLAPLESYEVTSSFATNRLKLYGKEAAITAIVIVVLLVIFALILKFALKWFRKKEVSDTRKAGEVQFSPNVRLSLTSFGISFATSILILGYTFAVIVGASLLNNIIGYQFQQVIGIFILIISVAVYAVLLFAPAIYFGTKKGIGWGILTVVLTILWLVFYMVVAIFFLFLLRGPSSRGPVLPLLESLR